MRGTTAWLWLPSIWMGLLLSRPLAYWFSGGSLEGAELEAHLDGSPVDRNALILLISLGLVALPSRKLQWGVALRDYRIIWLFYAFAIVSTLWAPYPVVAMKRVIRELGNVLMILIMLSEARPIDSIRRVFVQCTLVLVPLSVLFIKYYPEIGRYYHRWTYQVAYSGVTTNKNSLGLLAMLGGLFLLWYILGNNQDRSVWQRFRTMWPESIVFALCLWILNLANSATASTCFFLGVAAFIYAHNRGQRLTPRASMWTTLGIGLFGALVVTNSTLRGLLAQSVGRDSTFTERTDIWEGVLALPTNPFVGAGFSSVWLTSYGWTLRDQIGGLAHAHNGYLETYLNGGFVGVGLLVAVLLLAARQAGAHLRARTSAGPIYLTIVIIGVVYNFTEVTFSNGNGLGVLLWIIAMSAPAVGLRRPVVATSRPRAFAPGGHGAGYAARPTWRQAGSAQR